MLAYILRRLLLMIPTILGIMAVSFAIVQFVPGGPVERAISQLQGADQSSTAQFGGGGGQIGAGARRPGATSPRAIAARRASIRNSSRSSRSNTASTSRRWERFWILVRDYSTFNFGKSYYRDVPVLQLIKEKLPVSISLGMWMTLHLLRDLDSARRPQGGQGRLALRHRHVRARDLRLCDSELSVRGVARCAVLRRIVLADLSAARPDLRKFRRPQLAAQDPRLSLAYHPAGDGAGLGLVRDLDVAHEEFLPRRDQESLRADRAHEGPDRAACALWPRVPQRDADRHRRLSRAPSSAPSSPARF